MAYSADQLSQMLWDTLKSDPKASYDDVVKAATPLGIDLAGIEQAYKDVGNQAFQTQFGRDAVGREASDALYYLTHVAGLDEGQTKLNNSQEGYNYDTNDLVAAYRETFGRNPTQEEYVGALATLGVDNFDRATLGENGLYTGANVAALESDPYAGRYAGYNPYDLPADAANVSTNILGDQVQYISPITQRPVVANFNDGDLELSAGHRYWRPHSRSTHHNDGQHSRCKDGRRFVLGILSAPGCGCIRRQWSTSRRWPDRGVGQRKRF